MSNVRRYMEEFEKRLARLEQSNARYRSILTVTLVLLTVLCVAGFGQVQQQTFPRNIVADSLTVTTLNAVSGAVNQLGVNNATVQFLNLTDGRAEGLTVKVANIGGLQAQKSALGMASARQLDVTSQTGAGLTLSSSGDGGEVSIFGPTGRGIARLGSQSGAGSFSLNSRAGFTGVEAGVDDKGGRFKVLNANNRMLASITRADKGDGEIATYNDAGNRVVILKSEDDQKSGKVIVQKEGAFPMVTLGADAKGGLVKTQDENNETARLPAK